MKKYRKKPVVITALTYDDIKEIQRERFAGNFSFSINGYRINEHFISGGFKIHTLEGDMTMKRTDMLIVGVEGEIYPCDGEIFKKTYEEVE